VSATRHRLGGYHELAAPATLVDCVESVWIHRTPADAPEQAPHRVLPDLGVSLAFQGFRAGDGTPVEWAPVIVGPKLRAQIFDLVPGRELAAIRIKPEWIGPLLGIDPMSVEDRVEELAGVVPTLAERLSDDLAHTRSASDAVGVLLATVQRLRGACRTAPSSITASALELFRGTAGTLSCERMASRLGLSDRHLRRHVHDATGIAPKAYSRAVRFVTAMLLADGFNRPAWADVAAGAGYCDQSHLIRDAVAMAGVSPRDLHAERRGEIGFDVAAIALPDVSGLSNPR
jgi:AraC-like DNA-binding protein